MQIHMLRELKAMKKGIFHYVKLTNQLLFKTNFKKWNNLQEASG